MDQRPIIRVSYNALEKLLILSRPRRFSSKQEVMESDGGATKRVGFDDIGASLEILAMDLLNDVRLGELKKFEAAFQVLAFPVSEPFSSIILLRQLPALNHRAHGAVENDDSLTEKGVDRVQPGSHTYRRLRNRMVRDRRIK